MFLQLLILVWAAKNTFYPLYFCGIYYWMWLLSLSSLLLQLKRWYQFLILLYYVMLLYCIVLYSIVLYYHISTLCLSLPLLLFFYFHFQSSILVIFAFQNIDGFVSHLLLYLIFVLFWLVLLSFLPRDLLSCNYRVKIKSLIIFFLKAFIWKRVLHFVLLIFITFNKYLF